MNVFFSFHLAEDTVHYANVCNSSKATQIRGNCSLRCSLSPLSVVRKLVLYACNGWMFFFSFQENSVVFTRASMSTYAYKHIHKHTHKQIQKNVHFKQKDKHIQQRKKNSQTHKRTHTQMQQAHTHQRRETGRSGNLEGNIQSKGEKNS